MTVIPKVLRYLNVSEAGRGHTRSPNVTWASADVLEIHPDDAEMRGIKDGDMVGVASRAGEIVLAAQISTLVRPGVVYTTFHFPESGANVDAEQTAATAVGLKYFHVPFNGASPDPAAADRFLAAITTPGAEPAFIHCAGGNRAATMWLIKRLAVDHWDVDRATTEATALGMTSPALKQFAITYAQSHKR